MSGDSALSAGVSAFTLTPAIARLLRHFAEGPITEVA
jgi:hypothetical protein